MLESMSVRVAVCMWVCVHGRGCNFKMGSQERANRKGDIRKNCKVVREEALQAEGRAGPEGGECLAWNGKPVPLKQ